MSVFVLTMGLPDGGRHIESARLERWLGAASRDNEPLQVRITHASGVVDMSNGAVLIIDEVHVAIRKGRIRERS